MVRLVMGQFEAYDKGTETASVVDVNGNLKEGPGFTIFAIKDPLITTPANVALQGITRKTTIELAIENDYRVVEGDLSPELARSTDELFVTRTAGDIMAISTIDGLTVGNKFVANMTEKLQEDDRARHNNPLYATAIV